MAQRKKFLILIIAIFSFLVIFYINIYDLLFEYKHNMTALRKYKYDVAWPIENYNGTEDYLINTPGCYIPNYSKTIQFVDAKNTHKRCDERAIFVNKIQNDVILFSIDEKKIWNYTRGIQYECCYSFVKRSNVPNKEDSKISYTRCEQFKNGTKVKLKEEALIVTCNYPKMKSKEIYRDSYLVLKKIVNNRANEIGEEYENTAWNILAVGLDTMSRVRLLHSMPATASYLDRNGWLDYKGYQKVEYNTFPNLVSLLTGRNMSTIYKTCSKGMDVCNKLMIWSDYKESGYVTAYGEDYLQLPDTFSRYNGFKFPPTDHYTRPFFLTGEEKRGNIVCANKLPSAINVLNYAGDFVEAYKDERFFGLFWLNSISHNIENLPGQFDSDIVQFFEKVEKAGVVNNTFIIFLSDHGLRYGPMRKPVESYYEERLPMFFLWVPYRFRERYPEMYYSLRVNQNRLTTPYDVYATFTKLLKKTNYTVDISEPEACPDCTSMLEEQSPHRTCMDANVNVKWCTCNQLHKLDKNDTTVKKVIQFAVDSIRNKSQTIETIECRVCIPLELDTVLRVHSFKYDGITYYVIALVMKANSVSYEVTVEKDGEGKMRMVEPTHTISPYNTRGNCVKRTYDREFCVCDVLKNCDHNKSKRHK